MRPSIGTMSLANLKIMFFVEEIVFTANAKNSMQIKLNTSKAKAIYMQLNLKDNFLWKFVYCTTILYYISSCLKS